MNNQSYYRLADGSGCDLYDSEHYIVVNCTGVCVLPEPFTSHNRTGRQDFYLMYLVQGTLDMEIGGQPRVVQSGQLVIYPPGCAYRYSKASQDTLVYFWAHFTGYGARSMLDDCSLGTATVYTAGVSGDAADSFAALFRNFIHRDSCFEAAGAALLTSICVLLRRKIDGVADTRSGTPRVHDSLHFMHSHYSADITISALAAIEHLSVSRYCAVFKQCLGMSPQNFLIDLRLSMATELMLDTDLSLKQIARSVGYEDPLYFSRLFKRRKSISPRQFMVSAGRGTR